MAVRGRASRAFYMISPISSSSLVVLTFLPVRSLAVMFFLFFVFAFGPRLESCMPSDDNDMNQNFKDSPWLGNLYRLHRFRSTASPVKGLTADILVCPPHLIFFSLPLSSLSLLLTNCAKACDSGDSIRARASISEVGSRPMDNICGGSARAGSRRHFTSCIATWTHCANEDRH